jgi:hypothetical protein
MPDAAPRVHLVPVEAPAKPWHRSRTVRLNLAVALLLLIDALSAHLGQLQPLVPASAWPALVAVLTIANVWLRALTRQPLGLPRRPRGRARRASPQPADPREVP